MASCRGRAALISDSAALDITKGIAVLIKWLQHHSDFLAYLEVDAGRDLQIDVCDWRIPFGSPLVGLEYHFGASFGLINLTNNVSRMASLRSKRAGPPSDDRSVSSSLHSPLLSTTLTLKTALSGPVKVRWFGWYWWLYKSLQSVPPRPIHLRWFGATSVPPLSTGSTTFRRRTLNGVPHRSDPVTPRVFAEHLSPLFRCRTPVGTLMSREQLQPVTCIGSKPSHLLTPSLPRSPIYFLWVRA